MFPGTPRAVRAQVGALREVAGAVSTQALLHWLVLGTKGTS